MHISPLSLRSKITIHLARKIQITLLLAKKFIILTKYLDFAYIFSKKSAEMLSEQIKINEYAIDLEKSYQLPYGPIYSLEQINLKVFKTYIKTNLANSFIKA